ncbi:kinase-like domain-containing protein [Ilyonectria sp. MPI-CAGE-AT-0026]|nr:kinase-like domain-containing protein [Ilyonectria sp. MPI-CAGE-AT-0026]
MTAFTSKFCFKRKKNSRTSLTQFRTDINSAFIQSAFEKSQKFLPETAVHDFCTEAQVQGLLPRASRDLVDFLCKNAKRAFLTLLLCIDEPTKLFKAAQSFQQCRLTDECLPIQGREMQCENKSVSRPQSQSNSKCVHDHASDVFRDWDDLKFAAFCEYQWRFMSPIFKNSEFKQILNSLSVLPFTWVNEYPRDGHFSTVREARLHAAHHESQQSTEEIHVAIKQLKNLNGEPGYDVQRAWELEAQALDKISMIHDNHLINRIAAFKRGQDYFILFEWASGGNLRDFWKENRTIHEKLDGNHIICLLKQLRGLARALDRLHGTTQRSMSAVPTGSSIGSSSVGGMRMDDASITAKNHVAIPIKVNGDENYEELTSDEHWRHGDLKPDNILKFDGEHSDLFGILKIADLGLAKQHKNATSFRDSPTNTTHTTWHYEAPEVATKSHQPRSRRYDIWSIGCIILESITWLLYGYDVLNKFLEMDSNPQSSRDSLYFSTFNNSEGQLTAKISHTSKLWMEHILLMDPECNKPMATAIGDVLKLVRDKLLVVELPDRNMGSEGTAQCRADSSTLSKSLNKIWETALVNPSYGFSGANRRGVKAPTPQISFGGQLAPGHHQPHGPAASQHLVSQAQPERLLYPNILEILTLMASC